MIWLIGTCSKVSLLIQRVALMIQESPKIIKSSRSRLLVDGSAATVTVVYMVCSMNIKEATRVLPRGLIIVQIIQRHTLLETQI